MKTTVQLTNDNYLSGDEKQAVLDMVHNQKEETTFNGQEIKLVSSCKKDDEMSIVVEVL